MEKSTKLFTSSFSSTASTSVLNKVTRLIEEQTSESIPTFIAQSFHSLLIIEHWTWEILGSNSRQWINEQSYSKLFYALASFNMKLIFCQDNIEPDTKASLLLPDTIECINNVFEQINKTDDTTDETYFKIINLWFDVLSHLIHEYNQYVSSHIFNHINYYIGCHYLMSDQYKFYLTQLRERNLPDSVLTSKLLFYIRTCTLSVNAGLDPTNEKFSYTIDQILEHFAEDYSEIIRVHSYTVTTWSKQLLTCITHLISLIASICYWDDKKTKNIDIFVPSTDTSYEFVQALIRIICHKPFHEQIKAQWSNDETILFDAILIFLTGVTETQDLSCRILLRTALVDLLQTMAQTTLYDRICLGAYGILGVILSENELKRLNIAENMVLFFFNIIEQAWRHPTRRCKQIPISRLLHGCVNFSKNDIIQRQTAKANKVPLLVEMCDEYPIVFDILWGLSFNPLIQEQLHLNQSFMTKLNQLDKNCTDENICRIVSGILWNLDSKQDQNVPFADKTDERSFDIMISYSHKERFICKQLYEELIRRSYRVWIDFDHMHGNVMDAMAKAIEGSHTILICMSEHYKRSNYCRAEAQYAFKRQLKIVPVLLQQLYKPDGWLAFLIGELLYVNFTKYNFQQAFEMLINELNAPAHHDNTSGTRVSPPKPDTQTKNAVSLSIPEHLSTNMRDWTQAQVHDWLTKHNLVQMSGLLFDYDGRSLMHLMKFVTNDEPKRILSLMEKDSLRRIKQTLSLVEFARLCSLMEQ
ncbi:unnamed protein product [Rotaria sp. Silwood2]|nr:unnamed protein product [Rotaria sp. Silwood2]CAF3232372.1 unnamed protein product [Rotaria sp. Silwood2]CAF4067228.1 unnamed protein product [Rotaria sp. Silwood2]CAF4222542.1 unnamed protein product [Rotaria sp. Silwood2]